MRTPFCLMALLAMSLHVTTTFAAESAVFYDKRIPRQEFGATPAQSDRTYMLNAMQTLPLDCGVEEASNTHQAHEQAFKRTLVSYRGTLPAEQVIGHILMTERNISEVQMVAMVSMLGSMQSPSSVAVLRNLKRWSTVLSARFVSENVPAEQRQLVQNGIERSLRDSLNTVATRYRLSL